MNEKDKISFRKILDENKKKKKKEKKTTKKQDKKKIKKEKKEHVPSKEKKVKKKSVENKKTEVKERERIKHPEREIMIVKEDNEYYGIPLDYIDEIKKDVSIIQAPNLPDFLTGVTDIRGEMVPIVDFANITGLRKKRVRKTPVIITTIEEQLIGFQFEELLEIINIQREDILELPDIFPPRFFSGAYSYNTKIVGILIMESLLKGKHLKSLSEVNYKDEK